MTRDTTPVTVTLPVWYLEELSVDVENETIGYVASIRWAERHGTPDMVERIRAGKALYEAVETAITNALEAVDA